MIQSLFGKIAIALLGLFICVGTALVIVVNTTSVVLQEEATQKLHLKLAANIVDDAPLIDDQGFDDANIESAFHSMMMLGPAIELYILSPQGELLNYAAPEEKIMRKSVNLQPIIEFLEVGSMMPIKGDDPRSAKNQKIFTAAPVYFQGIDESPPNLAGYLYIIIGGEDYDSVISMLESDRLLNFVLATLVSGLVFFLLVLLLLYFYLTRPIKKLSQKMLRFRESDFLETPDGLSQYTIDGNNELNNLNASFREIAIKVVSQINEMMQSKKLRQELITHVSHDLRTPLAGIKGYLETWQMKHGTASPEDIKQYVDSAMKNCTQLGALIDELFELSRLEGNDIEPVMEGFPLPELIDDIIQKLSATAAKKNIRLECQSCEGLPFVNADIAQMDRVFSNLLDNAIRHTPCGGQVLVRLSLSDDQTVVKVKICDTGCGIQEEELDLLFEPYFQGSNQANAEHGGSGLGLAIAKRLLALHNTDIRVSSKLGSGTVFQFFLPVFGSRN